MAFKEFNVEGIGKVKIFKRKSSRYLRITVPSIGQVRVTTPMWVPYKAGLAFVRSKQAWITSQHASKPNTKLSSNQQIGKTHHLVFCPDTKISKISTRIKGNEVVITYPETLNMSDDLVQTAGRNAAVRALRSQARHLLGIRLNELSKKHNLAYRGFTVKSMRSRWGSCDQNKHIVLNLYLIQLPWELIDYVIIHELAHTKILRHGPDFWREVEHLLPDFKSRRKGIKQFRPTVELY